MTEQAIGLLITGGLSLLGTVVTGYFGLQIVRSNNAIHKTTSTTLQHVNHARIEQQRLYALAARTNAELSSNPGYRKIAEDAEAVLAALVKSQESIDRGDKQP